MLDRKFINEKVDSFTVFDIFEGDVNHALAVIKHMVYRHGHNVQMHVDELNPLQINIFKGRYETNEELQKRAEDEKTEKARGVEFKKRQLMERLVAEFSETK